MNKTKIEWVKNPDGTQGYTLNSKTGCLNHTDGLCKGGGFPCYAYKLANGRLRSKYLANDNVSRMKMWPDGELIKAELDRALADPFYPRSDPFYPRWWPERIKEPYNKTTRWGSNRRYTQEPKGIFLDDMSDWMGDYWPEEWTEAELQMMRDNPQHRIYTLTKQYQNLLKWSPFPDNCWVGVTACTNGMTTMALQYLNQIEAKVKYISFEPLLGQVGMNDHMSMKGIVDWVIIGAQTKPYKPPKIEWVREIVEAADKAGIPVFLKDNLAPLVTTSGRVIYLQTPSGGVAPLIRREIPE